jgi:hypothetical protein
MFDSTKCGEAEVVGTVGGLVKTIGGGRGWVGWSALNGVIVDAVTSGLRSTCSFREALSGGNGTVGSLAETRVALSLGGGLNSGLPGNELWVWSRFSLESEAPVTIAVSTTEDHVHVILDALEEPDSLSPILQVLLGTDAIVVADTADWILAVVRGLLGRLVEISGWKITFSLGRCAATPVVALWE